MADNTNETTSKEALKESTLMTPVAPNIEQVENKIDTSTLEGANTISNPTKEEKEIEADEEPKLTKETIDLLSCLPDFFSNFNLSLSELRDLGNDYSILVQPDQRYPVTTIIQEVIKIYSTLDVRTTTYMSIFTLTAYCVTLLNAHILQMDLTGLETTSRQLQLWKTDAERTKQLKFIQTLVVPDFLKPLLLGLLPTNDIRNQKVKFTPSLSAAKFVHDYGRLIPPLIFVIMHDIIASNRPNMDPPIVEINFINTTVMTFNTEIYTVSNIIGAGYNDNTVFTGMINWFYSNIQCLFTPITSRSHLQRSILTRIGHQPFTATAASFNAYDYMLNYQIDVFEPFRLCLSEIDTILRTANLGSQNLVQCIKGESNTLLLTHTIEPLQMPTWHHYQVFTPGHNEIPTPTLQRNNTVISTGNIIAQTGENAGKLKISSALSIPQNLQLFAPAAPENDPAEYMTAEDFNFLEENCLLLQPYQTATNDARSSLANGIKIENPLIDGFLEMVPNSMVPVAQINNYHLIAAIPTANIFPLIMRAVRTDIPFFYLRTQRYPTEVPRGLFLRDASVNVLPQFDLTRIEELPESVPGLKIVKHTRQFDFVSSYNTMVPDHDTAMTSRRRNILWSSFRFSPNLCEHEPIVYFYFDMRGLFGINRNVSQIPLPHTLFRR